MLAEYLEDHGYATAGMVANAHYCSYDTGLNRGFTHYEDYELDKLEFLRTAAIARGVLARHSSSFVLGVATRFGLASSRQEFLEPLPAI